MEILVDEGSEKTKPNEPNFECSLRSMMNLAERIVD
jgi:hypothetical protein